MSYAPQICLPAFPPLRNPKSKIPSRKGPVHVDQRRVVAFLALSFLVLMLHTTFFAPKPQPRKDLPAAAGDRQAGAEQLAAGGGEQPVEPRLVAAELAAAGDLKPVVEADLEYVTLGSVAENSPYRLLVTLTNAGAGVRRIELASERFRDLHDRGGYLGHLELENDAESGLLVRAVGAGTPAAVAGLEVGDRILSIEKKDGITPLGTSEELAQVLSKTKPLKEVTLQVTRGAGALQDLVVKLGRRPLEVIRPESENVLMRDGELTANFPSPASFQFTFEQLGKINLTKLEISRAKQAVEAEEGGLVGADVQKKELELSGVALRDANWEISERDATSVTFRQVLPQYGVEVLKRYSLEPVPAEALDDTNYPGYGLKLDLEVRNSGAAALPMAYRLDGPNGLPIEGWWYANKKSRSWSAGGIRDIVARNLNHDPKQFGPSAIAKGDFEPLQGNPLAYVGVDAQYFSAVMLPLKESLEDLWIDETRLLLIGPKPKARSIEGRYANVTCRLISLPHTIEAGQKFKQSYQIFTGPKRRELLAKYQAAGNERYSLGDLVYFGWFGPVAKVMLSILHFFYSWVGNYGIAIVLLTVLVRSCLFPISRKQAQSMAKMQELRPEMDKIKEKYKSDTQKQSQEMQELYRKHKINPLAGCLPMFIQLPIFVGLYSALMADVELRQAPLLGDAIRWCSNLASPDMFFDWSGLMPGAVTRGETMLVGLGPYLNVLPLVTIGLFLLQQKMFMPDAATEQAAMQQKIMKYMMLFMGLMFFKVASGLCLYFIASSLWGIAERKMLPKPTTPDGSEVAQVSRKPAPRSSKNGQSKNNQSKRAKKKKR